jgi:hypothetical protein
MKPFEKYLLGVIGLGGIGLLLGFAGYPVAAGIATLAGMLGISIGLAWLLFGRWLAGFRSRAAEEEERASAGSGAHT